MQHWAKEYTQKSSLKFTKILSGYEAVKFVLGATTSTHILSYHATKI